MKTKSLMTMLLGGAMLAACTADDALNSAPVAQEVNPSAPVFKVTFEDDDLQNRGELDGQYNMVWGNGDLMSLFHGVSSTNLTSFSGWQNAIYEAEGGDEGQLTFLTNAMVQLGYAMMVYPADLGFEQTPNGTGTAYPVISLPDVQDAETKGNTPYISEILNLTKDGADGTGVAGYRQEYDIVMRRAATTMTVNLKALKPALQIAGVDDFEIKSVELKGKNAISFTKSIKVKPSTNPRTVDGEQQTYWAYNTEMEIDQQAANIITTDVKDNSVVTFTLLKGTAADLEECSMVLHTNYGDITVDEEGDGQWVGSKNKTTTDALKYVYENTFAAAESGTFKGEEKGRAIALTVGVDLQDIKLDGMHIADENALRTALLVYEGVSSTETPVLILDGQGDDHVFEITDKDLYAKVLGYMTAEKETVKFQACTKDDNEKCLTVRLAGGATAAAAEEIANLKFDKTADYQTSTTDVAVELTGFWKYNSTVNDAKELIGVSELGVLGTLDLQSSTIDGNTKIVVKKGGNVLAQRSYVTLNVDLDNHGTVTINENCSLAVGAQKTLVNYWAEAEDEDDEITAWDNQDENGKCGVIINNGVLALVDVTNKGKTYNYGVIKMTNPSARTLISANATDGASLQTAFTAPTSVTSEGAADGNVFGSIILNEKTGGDGNTKIDDSDCQGFIKLAVTTELIDDNIGTVANYFIVKNAAVGATANKKLDNFGTDKYLEIRNNGVEVKFGTTIKNFQVVALIVPENEKVNVPLGVTLTVDELLFNEGSVTKSGTFTYSSASANTGYFESEEDVTNHIFTF